MTTTHNSSTQLPLVDDKERIKQELLDVISEMRDHFDVNQLINAFIRKAEEHDLFEKEDYTNYNGIILNNHDTLLINKLIWELIWDKKLIINLINNDYMFNSREFNLIKNI